MADVEIAVEFLVVWMTHPTRLGRDHAVANQDATSDLALRALHDLVAAKMHGDPALERLELEATGSGEVRPRTRTRLAMALEDATEDDHSFGKELENVLAELRKSGLLEKESHGNVTNQITGNVSGRVVQARDIDGGVTFYNDGKGR